MFEVIVNTRISKPCLSLAVVLQLFTCVDPSTVRKQKESYEDVFAKHEENFKGETEKIQRWRDALKEATSISGYDIQHMEDGHESRCIRQIAVQILNKLGHTKPKIADSLVGIEPQFKKPLGTWFSMDKLKRNTAGCGFLMIYVTLCQRNQVQK
ncbi:hypothetical protein K7X08_033554 [Anisodus acutangulus]|uniref:TIR domain-containing protein n=1 Tax=Anisodus acutangulus TaxID=402998 RepID=A0A9Q1M1V9_9SOLA|nr:hypothetical protein K7X08_033554 [Anisodus acutangulus]